MPAAPVPRSAAADVVSVSVLSAVGRQSVPLHANTSPVLGAVVLTFARSARLADETA